MNWRRVPLKSVSELGPQYGANMKAAAPSGRGVRYVRITDIDDFGLLRSDSVAEPEGDSLEDYILAEGDLLFARSGATVGKTYRYTAEDGKCAFAGYLVRFRPDRRVVSPRFLSYYFQTPEYWTWIQGKKRVAAQPNINGAEYASLQIPLPPLREQTRIVELLDHADRVRRLCRETAGTAARMLPALFLRIFGDPATNPKGWPTEPLTRVCNPKQWPTISSKELTESGFPVYGANGRIGFYTTYNHEHPTVLVTCRGATCGTINVCLAKSYVTGNAMALDDPDTSKTTIEFLEVFLTVRGLRDSITGAAQPQITRQKLHPVEIFIPPIELVRTFSSQAREMKALLEHISANERKLESLHASMLQRAFVGQLTSKWREAHMQELLREMDNQARVLNLTVPEMLEVKS